MTTNNTESTRSSTSIERIITFVGSPNFGLRSINRDLELQCTFISNNQSLIQRLYTEKDLLFGLSNDTSSSSASSSSVKPVGPHLGAEYDVWSLPERKLYGWSWSNGLWIHLGRRILAPFF